MARKAPVPIVLTLVAVVVLLSAAVAVARVRDKTYILQAVPSDSLYVTSGNTLRRLTFGYSALAADVYWIRALQYFGSIRLRAEGAASEQDDYGLLYPLLDLTTTLDPGFNIAYRFGSIFLAEPPPGGAGRADLAIRLLEKGLRERPDKWEYMLDIGFVHYWWTHDYQAAGGWFDKAGKVPGAPTWLRRLAATTLATGGDRQTSRQMWQAILESAENNWVRSHAEWRLLQLRALDDVQALQRLLDSESSPGSAVRDWRVLVRVGRLAGVPVDPTGTPYEIDEAGRVRLGGASSLYPLPDESVRKAPPAP